MGLTIKKEGENHLELSFTDNQKLSQNMLAELFGCEATLIEAIAGQKGIQALTGPKVSPDLEPTKQYKIKDFPAIVEGLKDYSEENEPESAVLGWTLNIDPKSNFNTVVPSGYTVIYRYEQPKF